jgi:transposase
VAELGTDFSRWKNESHFTSWRGLTPSREISGGKIVKQKSRKIKSPVANMLRMAASSLIRSESYLGARYRSLRTRLGAGKAIKAMARYLACLVYRMFTHG